MIANSHGLYLITLCGRWSMDPFNPIGGQFETFDPYGEYAEVTAAAYYNGSCDPGGININCGCTD
jgi:hypothetical protein